MDRKTLSILQEKARGTYRRNEEIRNLSKHGWNNAQIARRFALSRQAVFAIVRRGYEKDTP